MSRLLSSSSLCLLFLAFGAIVFSTNTAFAQSAVVYGRVQNVATGQYLNNARVAVRGTDIVAFTDQSGTFRLPQVPPGRVILDVFYTGLDSQEIVFEAGAGASLEKNVELTSTARYGATTNVVKLDSFVIAAARDTDGASIAINEQRFAANIKNVVAADALGDVMDGNVGEFIKFLPGITADYDNEDGSTVAYISIRGFGHSFAAVTSDGAPVASTSTTG